MGVIQEPGDYEAEDESSNVGKEGDTSVASCG
jgi:hypothetical protein